MLLSLGTIFITGVFSITSATFLSTPIITLKNCTHIMMWTEIAFETPIGELILTLLSTSGLKFAVAFLGLKNLQVITGNPSGNKVKSELMVSKSSVDEFTDPLNVTFLLQIPKNPDNYQIAFGFRGENFVESTSYFRKSNCSSSVTSDIVCENSCLCDTVIYKRCANGNIVNGTCSDPGNLFQSPGKLTFDGECPPGLSPGAIAGIVIGVIVGLIIIAAVVYFVLQKK